MKYDHKQIAKKWKKKWLEEGLYEVDLLKAKKPFYNLMMFPYPSAEGMHVGNMYAFTGADTYGRYMRMQGFDVFEPIGLDGFGIHSENYAIKVGRRPEEHARISQKNFYRQLSAIGAGFTWDHRLETYDPEYYKWTQWLFIQLFKAGLAYKKKAKVNWCPSCKTVLADEQVEAGGCERCKSRVIRKEMSSWHFKITRYADRLLNNLAKIDWPKKIKVVQRNWIGKNEGVEVRFQVTNSKKQIKSKSQITSEVAVFTTRLDTIYGVTFLALSPELVDGWIKKGLLVGRNVSEYIKQSLNRTEQQRKKEEKNKTGVKLEGLEAINPVNGKRVPMFVADYVLGGVGTGAVMGVPAYDKRDRQFAEKYGLKVVDILRDRNEVFDILKKKGLVKKQVNYHLRDWLISRQRYWGAPIPMVDCEKCGWQPVPVADLPVLLPEIEDFKPKGDGNSPLTNAPLEWKETKCPKCGGIAKRELDVSDTFLDSSWYFLGYLFMRNGRWVGGSATSEEPLSGHRPRRQNSPFNKDILEKWMPVDAYVGGAEHAVLHLLYARFIAMVLKDLGFLQVEEPFPFLFSHGLIIKDGAKMSKSRGNVIVPDEYIERFGADALRCYLMFMGPFDAGGDFKDTGMAGMYKFLQRVWGLFVNDKKVGGKTSPELVKILHKTIKGVGQDMSVFKFNTAIALIMELVNGWKREGMRLSKDDGLSVLKLLAPLAPIMTEELYQRLAGDDGEWMSIHKARWPEFDEKLMKEEVVNVAVQVNGKLRATVGLAVEKANDEEEVVRRALEERKVKKWLGGNKDYKLFFVPGRLVNFVV